MKKFGRVVHHARTKEHAAIVGLAYGSRHRDAVESSLDELGSLAETAGAAVQIRCLQERPKPAPSCFLGRGKVVDLARVFDESEVDLVVFDNELTPVQLRNLEESFGRRVVDRTQLILDIFASRARTKEGKLQVELAQLEYMLPRLAGSGIALSRLGAGIGTRGPGETKLETDRRRIRRRIGRLARELEAVRERRARSRDRRHKHSVPTVALVGYTNAGKSSLFNLLTKSNAVVSNALFTTLGPLVRPLQLPDHRMVLVSDTVGFIKRLPHTLVAAFRATLEEVSSSTLLLHVIDASHPDYEERMAAVRRVLEEVGADKVQSLLVLNKMDRLSGLDRERITRRFSDAIAVSALTGVGRSELVMAVTKVLGLDVRRLTVEFDVSALADRQRLSQLYRYGRVLRHERRGGRVSVDAEVPRRFAVRWSGRQLDEWPGGEGVGQQ